MVPTNGKRRFSNLMQRQTMSLISLHGNKSNNLNSSTETEIIENENNNGGDDDKANKSPVTEVKLEPIYLNNKEKEEPQPSKPYKGILKCPSESVKARLSSSRKSSIEDLQATTDRPNKSSRPSSSTKLDKIEISLQNTIKKVENNMHSDDIDKRIGEYCLQAIDSVKSYNDVIENHKGNLEIAKADTELLLESLRETETMELKLKHSHVLSFDNNNMTDDNLDFVNQILTDELAFKRKYKKQDDGDRNGSGVNKEPVVGLSDKNKLLATLRAIDNGDSVDNFDGSQRKNKLMDELFGNADS